MEKVKEANCVVKGCRNTNTDAHGCLYLKNRAHEVTRSTSERVYLAAEIKHCCHLNRLTTDCSSNLLSNILSKIINSYYVTKKIEGWNIFSSQKDNWKPFSKSQIVQKR